MQIYFISSISIIKTTESAQKDDNPQVMMISRD